MSQPRRAAFRVLLELDSGPALLESSLARHLEKAAPRDRAFATNLIFAVLRNRLYLDHLLAAHLDRPLKKLDLPVLTVLRLGAAEAVLLSTPAHAVVSAAVDLAKATPARRGQKLINAVLRRVVKSWQEVAMPRAEADPVQRLSLTYSHPAWLVAELLAQHPAEVVEAWLKANQAQPPLTLRVNPARAKREDLAASLSEYASEVKSHPLSPEGLMLRGVKIPAAQLPGFESGLFSIQDAAAQAMSHLLAVEPGMAVADLCSGAGGKTGHLAALLRGQGRLWAVDPSPARIRALRKNLGRLGAQWVSVKQADALSLKNMDASLDRVLVDAPCSGLGVCGRRPDVRWRRTPEDPARLAKLQLGLAAKAAELLKLGGAMLYVTCTVTRAENDQVVAGLLARCPGLRLEWPQDLAPAIRTCIGEDGFFRTIPHRDRADAFFAARLVKEGHRGCK
ncbi:MAG: 16S rRNA (cytosine(967)-C(5))-methyltransferase RsmB [Deltaproteobacteria bacterium]|nr:16S rRNA (cytosine(967)-C(5))-methyltransferase RsmB [Deltaproteobacteria bacterium]